MTIKDIQYNSLEGYLFLDQKSKLGIEKGIQKQITKFG